MDWLKQLTDLLGVNPMAFIALTALIITVTAIVRRAVGKAYEQHEWWKAVLSGIAIGLGVGGAFAFQGAGLYQQNNWWLVAVTGLFNGCLAVASHQILKHIPWLNKWLQGVVPMVLVLVLATTGCGSWLNDTRKGLLSANAAVNAYDDVAVEVWKDASINPQKHEQLGVSLCATVITQDALVEAWAITTLVAKDIAKESDITPYVSNAVVILDALEDYLEIAGVNLPPAIKVAIATLEALVPPVAIPPGEEPLEQCKQVLDERFPSAAVPWGVIVSAGAEFVLMVMEFIKEQDIPDGMLEQYLRVHLKQGVLYEEMQ